MILKPSFDNINDWLSAKPAGHFTIERWGVGWVIKVHRVGCPAETILCQSPGDVNQKRQNLSDEGLCGYLAKGA